MTKVYGNPAIIAQRMKQLRKEHHLTQQQLANELHWSVSTIKQYEAKKNRVPARQNLLEIAKYFNVSEAWLIGDSNYRTRIEEIDAKLGKDGLNKLRFEIELYNRFLKEFGVDFTELTPRQQNKLKKDVIDFIRYKLSTMSIGKRKDGDSNADTGKPGTKTETKTKQPQPNAKKKGR